MSTYQHFIDAAQTRVQEKIAATGDVKLCDFGSFDRYLALSALQKAIRRDDFDLAWNASSYLLENFPAHFWKRLVIIVMEDVGVALVDLATGLALDDADLFFDMVGAEECLSPETEERDGFLFGSG